MTRDEEKEREKENDTMKKQTLNLQHLETGPEKSKDLMTADVG